MNRAAVVLAFALPLAGCAAAQELLHTNSTAPRTGLVVQNPTCFVFCFGSVTESLRDTDIHESPNNPYSKRVIPDAFYP